MMHLFSAGRATVVSRGTLALALILALLFGGGLNLLAHHDHSLASSDSGCAACRVLETPVEAAPPQAGVPVGERPCLEAPGLPGSLELPADPAVRLDRLRGPPRA